MANIGKLSSNTIAFCARPWHPVAALLAVLVFMTFAWGFYILDHYKDDGFFDGFDDLSIARFLIRDVGAPPDTQRLLEVVPPAVVGVSGRDVNAAIVASGAIVGANGYVLTTLHSVAGLPDIDVHVRTSTGVKRYQAQIVKTEPTHDLALLKIRTADRFLFFVMGETQGMPMATQVFGFGYGARGTTVFRDGRIMGKNLSLTTDAMPISHLLASDAIYSWEQNGGPLVNSNGELVGISIAVVAPSGLVQGYAVPSHVIATHFQDVVKFKFAAPPAASPSTQMPGNASGAVIPSMPYAAPVAMVPPVGTSGSAPWWAMAKAQVERENPALGVNVAAATPVRPPSNGPTTTPASSAQSLNLDHESGISIGGYQVSNILGLAALALAAGVVGGMMTMGGGVVQVAGMMIFFGYGMYLIRPVAYLTNVFVYGAAALRNNRSGLVVWDNVRALAPWGVAGVIGGYFVGNAVDDTIVATVLGLFAMGMALKGLHEIFYDTKDEEILVDRNDFSRKGTRNALAIDELFNETVRPRALQTPRKYAHDAALGLPMGIISGLLGISGGVMEVPLQRFLAGMSLQNAIANSSVLVFWGAVGGAVVAFIHGTSTGLIDWQAPLSLALIMIPGAYVGGLIGAQLMKILPVVALKWIYTAVMLATSIKLLSVN
ncbi:MAG: TSUP family transporter [Alphaproteobacteria bacterium]|nr:TSUP family transporter [Alphaproteobacteria bacterium]